MDKNTENKENKRLLCTKTDVLVVDGNEKRGREICDILFNFGASSDIAESMEQAVKLANEHSFDMIFAVEGENDIIGLELIGKIPSLKNEKNIIFAVFMESFDKDIELEYMRNGFAAVLPLPTDETQIGMLLENTLPEEERQYIDKDTSEGKLDVRIAALFMNGVDVISVARKNDTVEDYLDLLDLFYTDGQKKVDSLNDKINSEDFKNYIIEVHGLKSAAANIGANALSELAKQHEFAGKESNFTYIEENKLSLFDCYEKILFEIERVLKKEAYGQFASSDVSSDEERETVSAEVILEHLKKALASLEAFNSKDAADEVGELAKYSLPANISEGVGEIQTMLKMYEDDDAEDKLRELIGTM